MTNNILHVENKQLRRARVFTLASLGVAVLAGLILPGVGVLLEQRPLWIVLGAVGVLFFTAAQAGALYATMTPWLTEKVSRRLLVLFGVASVVSVPLLAPVGPAIWYTWAWVGGAIAGSMPLLRVRRTPAIVVAVAAFVVTAATAVWADKSVSGSLWRAAGLALAVGGMSVVYVWLWDLLTQAEEGRSAQAKLAAAEERLRFARDVHDVLGHDLSVIALKAELASRLAPVDPGVAARASGEVQRLAAEALTKMRSAVDGYRVVDLRDQLAAIVEVLRSSGVRCTVTQPEADLPPDAAARLAPVLREASTNMLRHSQAKWCTIEVTHDGGEVRMTVANDGAGNAKADRYSSGLTGLADRLAEAGGRLRTWQEDGVFTLRATVRA
ncbi:two-component system sensor histidine kinase DesK [Kibdelosporangium banguiense]|uniref:Two-component system sensor histidine kinase DesK n=1 Tax=Kibdelosporangium banguiense TaxID=1365924 RepID=A0ABS4TZL7_9PSEU|nr:histidine kinase [Kibdelosporangium banguiense]MBP2329838.1 two-component system sensor histidine kinase DesK [Kibdelosporangium banguiense]